MLLLLALSELFEHITAVDLNIDNLLFPRPVALQSDAYVHPGRMSVPTTVTFLILVVSFCLARVRGRVAGVVYSTTSTTVLVLVGIALLAHLLEAEQFAGPLGFTLVAAPTAIRVGALAIGTLAMRTVAGWVGLLWNESVGASVARWLLRS
ncbi:hypothetical protein [Pelagibacterium sp. H642]|uniref:hypothetical protein n=1 Tax=Pelagibacterium sp. H642 TaxID=1881069 RepID=UPI0028155D3F|nr:hypothetical protein [Pelagibacterium sp. H642]WMT91980.1 hypothetical protein NO934_06915 [Pelagibacterium sp. H642]